MTKSETQALEELPGNIKHYRKKEKWSQKDLAERLGVSTAFVNHLEQGNRYPSIETLFKIANVFHVQIERLVMQNNNHKKKGKK